MKKKQPDIPQMPFDDALKRILSAPPQHRTAEKTSSKRKRNRNKKPNP